MRRLMLATVMCSCAALFVFVASPVHGQEDTTQVRLAPADQALQTVQPVSDPVAAENEAAVYMTMTDSEGNPIEGSVQVAGREGMIRVHKIEHTVSIPFDRATHELSGVRQHGKLMVVKEADRSSPLLFDALVNGETLRDVALIVYRPQQSGKAKAAYQITMEEVKLVSIETEGTKPLESVSMVYGQISWRWFDGNIESTDTVRSR